MVIGHRHIHLNIVDSTNEEGFRQLAAAGLEATVGLVVTANHQTRGRGRRGHEWTMPPGVGLCWSAVLREVRGLPTQVFALLGGVAVRELLSEHAGVKPTLDWPNDLLVGGRKISGVLVETRTSFPGAVVLGIGLNCLQSETGLRAAGLTEATSLEVLGHPLVPARAAEILAHIIDRLYARLNTGDGGQVTRLWRDALGLQGRCVVVRHARGDLTGTLLEITDRAGLVLDIPGRGPVALRGEHVTGLREARPDSHPDALRLDPHPDS